MSLVTLEGYSNSDYKNIDSEDLDGWGRKIKRRARKAKRKFKRRVPKKLKKQVQARIPAKCLKKIKAYKNLPKLAEPYIKVATDIAREEIKNQIKANSVTVKQVTGLAERIVKDKNMQNAIIQQTFDAAGVPTVGETIIKAKSILDGSKTVDQVITEMSMEGNYPEEDIEFIREIMNQAKTAVTKVGNEIKDKIFDITEYYFQGILL